jgi:hypothetical protein
MPTLAIIDGISILMWPNDHNPPHFHVRFAGKTGKFDITTGRMIKGTINRRTAGKVERWIPANRTLLLQAWTTFHGSRATTT